jgi:hypothetical protein
MSEERRQGDLLIMEKLSAMHTDLALNTRETTRIAEYQKATNGKVAAHESRLQAIESNQALTANALAAVNADRTERMTTRKLIYSRVAWAIAGAVVVFMQRILTYLIQNDVLKNIFN